MGVRHSVSYIKLLVTGWTAGGAEQGEGRVVAARRNTPRQIGGPGLRFLQQASSDMHLSTEQYEGFSVSRFAIKTAPSHCLAISLKEVHKCAWRSNATCHLQNGSP